MIDFKAKFEEILKYAPPRLSRKEEEEEFEAYVEQLLAEGEKKEDEFWQALNILLAKGENDEADVT